ncbi:MBOAT family protein [Nemorincola caseinilytica]|uniref:MBOAT family protein n=1 Tax=Nemorincola caseinilytica TaxID=2054315 RepID=A0ABP8N7B3_9BACT
MLFNSIEFVFFFIIVTGAFFLLPHKFRWVLLLVASCFFYMFFKPIYILILGFTIVIDYYAGILLENEPDKAKKKRYLVMSLVANIGVLAVFKYFNFFNDNITSVAEYMGYKNPIPYLSILLPIGLSFHTFQAMSYTIEVYRGNQRAERHFGIYSLYVMFYPQLVAGPIERPQNVLHQFHEVQTFKYDNVVSGLRLMLWGMFKKVVIADRLAVVTDMVFSDPHHHSSVAIAIGAVMFAFQIFCDFSGYSDIALGSARVMGFKLMLNFDRPFNSKSVTEFWRRWHISLSTWFNDYLFNPIVVGLRNWGTMAIVFGLLITFFISGFWHGAGWKFVIYGVLNGLALVYEYLTRKKRKKLFKKLPVPVANAIGKFCTVGFIAFSWIFFRAENVSDALYMVGRLPGVFTEIPQMISSRHFSTGIQLAPMRMLLCVALILFMEGVHMLQGKYDVVQLVERRPVAVRWGIYYVLVLAILYLGMFNNKEFIYFQF